LWRKVFKVSYNKHINKTELKMTTEFKTIINCLNVPSFAAVKAWAENAAKPLQIIITSYEETAFDADIRAMRLFSKLGALGCIANHKTQEA